MLLKKKEMFIKKRFTSSSDFEKKRNTSMRLINRLRFFETWEKSSWRIDSFTTSWKRWSKQSIINWKTQKKKCEKKTTSTNDDWAKITKKMFMSTRLLIETRIIVIMSSSLVVYLEKKKNRKTIFVFFFFSMMMFSIEKKKNQKTISVDFFFDRISSSSSLSSSSINFESRFVTQSFRSLSSSIFKDIAIMFDALMKNVVIFLKTRLKEEYLTKQHHEIFSSISFTSKSSSNAFCSRKKNKKMISITSKKRVKSSKNSCECAMSIRWREILIQINFIKSIKSVEHLLKRLYYLKRQVCERHINELERLYDLLSMKNLNEMKNIFWRLLQYSKTMKIFKIENVDLYKSFENDD
jgi:hypothetical protein